MTPRARRLLAAILLTVLLLFTGRWLADFVTSRWWAAAISPAAHAAVTRWHLLGLALDGGAVGIASAWFAAHALLVARSIGSVRLQRHVGERLVQQPIPSRWLAAGALATGVLLGLLTGAGARAWRAPLLLALNRPEYGITDPLLGVDLGVLVASYPLWRAALGFAVMLVVLGLVLTGGLYAAIGGIKREKGRLELHPDARRHLGIQFALLGAVIGTGYLLAPYRLATAIDVPLSGAAASTRVLAAHATAGAAIAAAALSLGWVLRSRVSLLISGWLVLALAAITERMVVPAFVAEAGSSIERAGLARQMDSVFHHIRLEEGTSSPDSVPPVVALWDDPTLIEWAEEQGLRVVALAPAARADLAHWLVITAADSATTSLAVHRVHAARTTGLGRPVSLDTAYRAVADARSLPGATGWAVVHGGVRVGSVLRPVAIAWARQAPGIWGVPNSASIDWARDPVERASALVPALAWRPVGAAHVDGRLVWLVSGLATVSRAPLATRVLFDDRTVSGVVPSLLAVIVAESGATTFYPDPSADPLGLAWARAFRGIVSPLTDLPAEVRDELGYPRDWFERQLEVLSAPHWGLGVPSRDIGSDAVPRPAAVWAPGPGALQHAMDDPERRRTTHILTGRRTDARAQIVLDRLAVGSFSSGAQLADSWLQSPTVEQLGDSLRATGDTLRAGPIRWHRGTGGMVAWQPLTNGAGQGPLAMVWLGTASPQRVSGARRVALAWEAVTGPAPVGEPVETVDEVARVEAVRSWVRLADSALARGDLTAFARAWEALRGLLLDSIPR